MKNIKKHTKRINQLQNERLIDEAGMGMIVNVMKNVLKNYDPIVEVDHHKEIIYPDFIVNPVYPDLAKACPEKFDIRTLEKWRYGKNADATGEDIRKFILSGKNMLNSQLGYLELSTLHERGGDFLLRYLGEPRGEGTLTTRLLFGWRSMALGRHTGEIMVPFLLAGDYNSNFIGWEGMDYIFRSGCYGLQYPSQK